MSSELSTDAYAFLNINHPLCAWAAYRGVLVCAANAPGYLSVWTTEMIRADAPARLNRELALEHFRRANYNQRISRLRGMFCFLDLASAEKACSWATGPRSHFRPEYLAELHLGEAGQQRDKLDANWIAHASMDENGNITGVDWIHSYWLGEPYPGEEPIWETLVDGRAIVLGTSLRERAYSVIKLYFPDSLMFLEIARMAAVVGSDLGNVFALLREDGEEYLFEYHQDMRDAEDPAFIAKLESLKESGHPINWTDITPRATKESFGKVMDLRKLGFRRPKILMPYIGQRGK